MFKNDDGIHALILEVKKPSESVKETLYYYMFFLCLLCTQVHSTSER